MHYTYILFSKKDKQLYIGFTDNLRSRFKRHQLGFVKTTKNRRPLMLIYYEAYINTIDAKRREKYLRGGNGRKEQKIQLRSCLENLRYKNI
jgi:putative endonuclease